MALPLPRVVSDVGPGGPLVTAMGGINSLANENILRQINQINKQYLPTTLGAEAASKLAYANLMGPQFLAKLLGNDAAVANMGDPAARAALKKAVGAGMGQNSGMNAFNQMQQGNQGNGMFSGIGEPSTNSFSGHLKKVFRALIGQNPQQGPNQNAFNMPAQDYGNSSNPRVSAEGPGVIPNGDFPFVGREGYRPHPTTTDYDGNQMQVMADDGNASMEMDMTGGQPRQQSDEWGASTPAAQQAFAEGREPTYAEKTGKYKGSVKQGEEAGKYRAQAQKEIGQSQLALSNSGASLNRMASILKDPVIQNMRSRIPFFQDKQLSYLKKMGTKEEQKKIGDLIATSEQIIASGVQAFGGKPLVREFDLLQRQKVNENDTIPVAEGKTQASIALHDIAEKKNDIISGLLQQGVNEADAVKQANKMVDINKIERATNKLLVDKITEDDIAATAKANGMTREQVIKRLKDEGRYNG
jgi:hypothetical protein